MFVKKSKPKTTTHRKVKKVGLFKDMSESITIFFKGSKKPQTAQENTTEFSSNSTSKTAQSNLSFFNALFKNIEGVLFSFQPKIYSLAQESNIMRKYDENLLVTKDFNVCLGVKLEGISYAAINEEDELNLAINRNRFFARLDDSVEMNIIAKKELVELENDTSTIKNP